MFTHGETNIKDNLELLLKDGITALKKRFRCPNTFHHLKMSLKLCAGAFISQQLLQMVVYGHGVVAVMDV
jgi:hypothetical protein